VRRLLPAVKFVLRHLTSRYLACLNGKFWGIINTPLTFQHKLINQISITSRKCPQIRLKLFGFLCSFRAVAENPRLVRKSRSVGWMLLCILWIEAYGRTFMKPSNRTWAVFQHIIYIYIYIYNLLIQNNKTTYKAYFRTYVSSAFVI
jgi:hypothetical protein